MEFTNTHMGDLHDLLNHLPVPKEGYYAYKNGVANLLSLAHVSKYYRVYYDSQVDKAFYILDHEGGFNKFEQAKNGLYLYHIDMDQQMPSQVLATLKKQRTKFSTLNNKRADLARSIQERLMQPSDIDLANAIVSGCIPECGISKKQVAVQSAPLPNSLCRHT